MVEATARLYGVDHDSMKYTRIGNDRAELEFRARTGMLVDLDRLRESIRSTANNTGMVISFEATALGEVEQTESEIVLNINGTNRQFVLVNNVEAKPPNDSKESALPSLRETLARGESFLSVTGYMDGSLEEPTGERPRMMVIRFEAVKEEVAVEASSPSSAPDGIESTPVELEFIENSIGMKLVRIPAGTFMMGSPRSEPDRTPNEELHEASITRPFYMSIHEVARAQYRFKSSDGGGGARQPRVNVNSWSAVSFCERLSNRPEESRAGRRYRLPTEAEWEYACRAGTTTPFHTGESISSREANFNGNYPYGGAGKGPYLEKTAPVGSYEPNAFGLYDMHGNVAEWCADFYDPDYYENSPAKNPPGPLKGVVPTDFGRFNMVVRGGSWLDDARGCRSAYRFRGLRCTEVIGLRVVCEVTENRE